MSKIDLTQLKESFSNILESLVLSDEIHSLLKKYKEDNKDDVKLSGTKPELIENLLVVVQKGIIPLHEVQALIKDAEEFGDQYIYILVPVDGQDTTYYNKGNKIADIIIPADQRNDFPKIKNMPKKLEWADFRFPNRGVANSWLIKLYDKKTRETKENERIDYSSGLRYVTYKKKESRLVYLIEWNGKNNLEFKISRTSFDSFKSLSQSRQQLEQLCSRALNIPRNFKKKNLLPVINKMLIDSEIHRKVYNLMSAKLVDSHNGQATISTYGEDESDLLSDESRKEAINAYLNGQGKANSIAIKFLAEGSDGMLTKDVNVVMGRHDINEIIISASISPQEYKYVRKKIAEFS